MGLRDLFGGVMGSGFKLPLPWMPSQSIPAPLPPVQLPRDERPHDRSIEWWHFMGNFRFLHRDAHYQRPPPAPDVRLTVAADDTAEPSPQWTFVLSILKARVQGITKVASLVILVDHQQRTHTVRAKLGAMGGVFFEPTDGSAIHYHFGAPGPARPGPPEAWSVAGGMGVYRLSMDVSRQISMNLKQLSTPAVLVGVPREDRSKKNNESEKERAAGEKHDGVMGYLDGDQMAYYAFPAMTLEGVLGTGADEQAIVGDAWMEHQWGDLPLGDYAWKYIAVTLRWKSPQGAARRGQLLIFEYRKRTNGEASLSHGIWVDEKGNHVILKRIEMTMPPESDNRTHTKISIVETEPVRPQGGGSSVKIAIPALKLTIEPLLEDQECRTELPRAIFPVFWEGACKVSGRVDDHEVDTEQSWAITEMAGYE